MPILRGKKSKAPNDDATPKARKKSKAPNEDAAPKARKKSKVPDEEAARRVVREEEMQQELLGVTEDPEYVALCDCAAAERRITFDAVFNIKKTFSPSNASLWKRSLRRMDCLLVCCSTPRVTAATRSATARERRGYLIVGW